MQHIVAYSTSVMYFNIFTRGNHGIGLSNRIGFCLKVPINSFTTPSCAVSKRAKRSDVFRSIADPDHECGREEIDRPVRFLPVTIFVPRSVAPHQVAPDNDSLQKSTRKHSRPAELLVLIGKAVERFKIFEMPLPGYFGFPAFALECFTMFVFLRAVFLRLVRSTHDRHLGRMIAL